MEIDKYMTPTEAVYKWHLKESTLRWHLKNEEKMDEYIKKGWAKSFLKPGGQRKEWIVTVEMMGDLFGPIEDVETTI